VYTLVDSSSDILRGIRGEYTEVEDSDEDGKEVRRRSDSPAAMTSPRGGTSADSGQQHRRRRRVQSDDRIRNREPPSEWTRQQATGEAHGGRQPEDRLDRYIGYYCDRCESDGKRRCDCGGGGGSSPPSASPHRLEISFNKKTFMLHRSIVIDSTRLTQCILFCYILGYM
jgi:hypothetical protein